jgi:transposase
MDRLDLSYVGIDIAKAKLDIAIRPSGQQWVSAHDEEGIAEVTTRLQALQPRLIVLEATGGREIALVAMLAAAGLPVAVINPRQARDAGPRHRSVGQDRCARCGGPGPLR